MYVHNVVPVMTKVVLHMPEYTLHTVTSYIHFAVQAGTDTEH